MRLPPALPVLLPALLLAGIALVLRFTVRGFAGTLLGYLCMGLAVVLFIAWLVTVGLAAIRRRYSARTYRVALACTLLLPPFALATAVQLKLRSAYLSVVPWQLDVHRIEYRKEKSWGLPLFPLPGDNETGIRIYRLPGAAAQALEQQGIAYLRGLPDLPLRPSDPRTRGRYAQWHETPLDEHARRHVTNHCDDPEDAFCIQVDAQAWAEVQRVISARGSYYAIGRSGVIVIDPARRRVFYMYNG